MSEKMELKSQVRLRPATDTDVNFIFHSWLKCYRHSPNTKGVQNPVYFAQHHLLMEGLCKRANILVACNDTDITQIYGYVCYEMVENLLVIHWIYTKETFRKLGIANILAEAIGFKRDAPVLYTHRTYATEGLERRFPLVYNPYLAYYAYELAKS